MVHSLNMVINCIKLYENHQGLECTGFCDVHKDKQIDNLITNMSVPIMGRHNAADYYKNNLWTL